MSYTHNENTPPTYLYEADGEPQDDYINGTPEIDLVTVAQAGDLEVYTSVYEHHRTSIDSIVSWSDYREEIVQEAFIKGWHGLPDYVPSPNGIGPWLRTVAYNHATDLYRRDVRRYEIAPIITTVDVSDMREHSMPTLPNIDEGVLASDAVRHILALVAEHISPEAAKTFEAIYLHDKTPMEHAEEQGLAHASVNTRIYKARKKLERIGFWEILAEAGIIDTK